MGTIDFRLLDPNAMLKGAEGSNRLLTAYAHKRAGALLANGNNDEAYKTLAQSGDIEGAQNFKVQLDANDARLQKMTDAQRARQTEMVIDTANVLENVRKTQGEGAVLPAFEQMVPLFKHHGATDEELAPIRQGLQSNAGPFLQNIISFAQSHAKEYNLSPSQTHYRGTQPIAHAPALSRAVVGPAGSTVSEYNPDQSPMSQGEPVQVETDEEFEALPSGQAFIAPDGHMRIKP